MEFRKSAHLSITKHHTAWIWTCTVPMDYTLQGSCEELDAYEGQHIAMWFNIFVYIIIKNVYLIMNDS